MRPRTAVWLLIAAGTALRLVIAFKASTGFFDINSFEVVRRGLHDHGLNVYSAINGGVFRWPYPPGYFPAIGAMRALSALNGLDFLQLMRLPPIGADAAIAWLVQDALARRGATTTIRLAATAAVALGPVFVGTAGYHGQIDSVAILPAVAAIAVWTAQPAPRHRALIAGLLIGVGASIKTVPILMLAALIPLAANRREALTLAGAAVAVPLAAFAPFLIADWGGATHTLSYHGLAGLGGLSLVAQPNLALSWIAGRLDVHATGVVLALNDAAPYLLAAALLAAAMLIARRRRTIDPWAAAALVWLTVYVFGVDFLLQYLVWGLPFFLVLGAVRSAWALQLAVAPALLLAYLKPNPQGATWALYTVELIAVWVGFAIALALLASRVARGAPTASRAV